MRVILIATDGSRAASAALDEAISLAAETGDGIAAITVWRALQGDFGLAYPSTAMLDELLDAERAHAEAALDDAAARAEAADVRATTHLATGDPTERICTYAREIDARLIAIGRRGHSPVASLLLGSVSNAVLRHATCPVLVVREPERARDRSRADHVAVGHSGEEPSGAAAAADAATRRWPTTPPGRFARRSTPEADAPLAHGSSRSPFTSA
jgi:nucleotide-binding universal stress UspA family protein